MDLSLERPGDYPYVRRVGTHAITVVDRELTHSFVLTLESVIEDWPVHDARSLGLPEADVLMQLQPDVVLLGTGTRQVFPSAEVMAAFLHRGIGIEVMDNAAAARTHTVLAAEGRNLAAAFIL